jgi:diguanylate cyclase (GGDEF)-like protein
MSGYYELEKEYSKIEYKRVFTELDEYRTRLDVILRDWAIWDDTYNYIVDRDNDYIDSNIVNSTFENMKIDYIVLLTRSNNVAYKGFFNQELNTIESNVDAKIIELIKNAKNESGFYYINDKILIINKKNVVDSQEKYESNGKIIFAYYLPKNEVYEKLNVGDNIVSYGNHSDLTFTEEYIVNKNDNKMELIFLLPYQNVDKAVRVQIDFSNKISKLGRETSLNLIWFYISFVVIMVTMLLIVLDRFIVNKVLILNDRIKCIAKSRDLTKRIFIKGSKKDEIFELENNINHMLERIEILQKETVNFATIDTLTKVYNRRVGLEKLEKLLYESLEEKKYLAICYIDINNLKIVNDKLGHNDGDQLIIDVIEIIKKNIRNIDFISRLGGDEFLLVLPSSISLDAESIMKRVNKSIDKFNDLSERKYILSISAGIAEYNLKESLDEFIERADVEMYKNKVILKKQIINTIK